MEIENDRLYSVNEVVKAGLVKTWRNNITAVKAVYSDKILPKSKRVLDAEIIGDGVKKRIYIKGERLAKYAAQA